MKNGLAEIIGKTIADVIVARHRPHRDPANQVFLVFDDGSYFEFWGADFNCNGGVDLGGVAEVSDCVERIHGSKIVATYPTRSPSAWSRPRGSWPPGRTRVPGLPNTGRRARTRYSDAHQCNDAARRRASAR